VEIGVDKNTTVVFPAPLMSTIQELGAFLAREAAAITITPPPPPAPPTPPTGTEARTEAAAADVASNNTNGVTAARRL